jgi:long-subunit acyl-CoA synthetase (AMP-forming)
LQLAFENGSEDFEVLDSLGNFQKFEIRDRRKPIQEINGPFSKLIDARHNASVTDRFNPAIIQSGRHERKEERPKRFKFLRDDHRFGEGRSARDLKMEQEVKFKWV